MNKKITNLEFAELMEEYSNQEIMELIRQEDRSILLLIYKTCFPAIRSFVLLKNGSISDAEDIFQDSLLLTYLKVKDYDFRIKYDFGYFLFSVAKHLWLRELSERKKMSFQIGKYEELIDQNYNIHSEYIRKEKRKLFIDLIFELCDECRMLLLMYMDKIPEEKIINLMGYSSVQYARNRRTVCKDRLVKKLWNSRRYKELTEAEHIGDLKIPI